MTRICRRVALSSTLFRFDVTRYSSMTVAPSAGARVVDVQLAVGGEAGVERKAEQPALAATDHARVDVEERCPAGAALERPDIARLLDHEPAPGSVAGVRQEDRLLEAGPDRSQRDVDPGRVEGQSGRRPGSEPERDDEDDGDGGKPTDQRGGVRTALFNWLLARHAGGQFILRIDDTDQERHVEDAVARSSTASAGWGWTGTRARGRGAARPVFPVERRDRYTAAAAALVASGHVYRDYTTEQERAADKAAVETAGRLPIPAQAGRDATWLGSRPKGGPTPSDSRSRSAALVVHDLIKGDVEQKSEEIGDFVIVRPDGTPLYNFASVVDDAEMRITHVVRAEEHLSNTFSQLLVFEALGYALPASRTFPSSPSRDRRRNSPSATGRSGSTSTSTRATCPTR